MRLRPLFARVLPAILLAAGAGFALLATGCASPPGAPPAWTRDFAFRDPAEGPGGVSLGKGERKKLDAGLAALRAGDREAAAGAFHSGENGPGAAPFRLGLLYVDLASGRYGAAREGLAGMLASSPDWAAAVEARADLDAVEGRGRVALEGYRTLLRLVPEDPRASRRAAEMEARLLESGRADAERALERHDLNGARRAAAALVELKPASPEGFRYLARAAEAAGENEGALEAARKAHSLDEGDVPTARMLADLAMKTGRYGEAAAVYAGLATADPSFRQKADEARQEFLIHNLPEAAQRAALAARVTRAQFAALAYWLVPEVREAPAPAASEVAVDAVGRPERAALVKAIGLGFFGVSRETHVVGADVPIGRSELAALLKRLAYVVRRKGEGCLWAERVTPASLAECGILQDATARNVTGKEALAAIEAAARAAREGGSR